MRDCQNFGCLARGTEWCDNVGTPNDTKTVTCYGYTPLVMDDLIPDESVPDSAWTNDAKQEGCVHVTTKFRCNNGDKIRYMDNEQLARYLWIETSRMTVEEWLDWLNREAK